MYYVAIMNTATRIPIPRKMKKQKVMKDGISRVTLSFYKYFKVEEPKKLRDDLFLRWSEIGCLGRIYVAKEGINAQMSVPTQYFDRFDAYMKSRQEFRDVPYKIAVEEGEAPSFYKLTIKVRDKIVADGLDDASFDVTNTGDYLTASEFNEYINDPEAVVVDMRNAYESEVGHFNSAVLPDVDTFRDELKHTPEMLRVHKNRKIALYCTGGIRCEKASAWLKHNGYENVRHLKGGIIDYARQVKDQGLDNKFRGKNFVFDERLGERVGEDVISFCHLCSENKSDTHLHCKNQICHVLFLGCDECVEKKNGYCSKRCELFDKLPKKPKKIYARYYNKYFRPAQFRKHRLKSKTT